MALGAASRRSLPPAGPPAASHGQPTVLHQLRPPRTRLRRSRCAQPPRRRNSAVRGRRQCRSAGQWRAPRPVSPGTVTLMADARCARRSADALNELRPLRQRVSRAAGICLPAAAAGCERSLARRCRQSAARCGRPGRRSSSPTTHHPRTWRTPNRLMALGTRSARCACVRRPPTTPLLSRCSRGFALANPPLVAAARASYKIEATPSLYTSPRCAVVGDGSALPQHDPHPAAGPLAQRASVAEDDWSMSGPTLDPLTGRSSCCRLPGRYRRRVPPP